VCFVDLVNYPWLFADFVAHRPQSSNDKDDEISELRRSLSELNAQLVALQSVQRQFELSTRENERLSKSLSDIEHRLNEVPALRERLATLQSELEREREKRETILRGMERLRRGLIGRICDAVCVYVCARVCVCACVCRTRS